MKQNKKPFITSRNSLLVTRNNNIIYKSHKLSVRRKLYQSVEDECFYIKYVPLNNKPLGVRGGEGGRKYRAQLNADYQSTTVKSKTSQPLKGPDC